MAEEQLGFQWFAAKKRKPIFAWAERKLKVRTREKDNPTGLVLVQLPDPKLSVYKPLDAKWGEPGLFLTFANTEPTPEACLRFSTRFGPLGESARIRFKAIPGDCALYYPDEYRRVAEGREIDELIREKGFPGEWFGNWRAEISWMHHLTDLWKAAEVGDQATLSKSVAWEGSSRVVFRFPAIDQFGPLQIPGNVIHDWRWRGEAVWENEHLLALGTDVALFPKRDLEGPARLFVESEVNRKLRKKAWPVLSWDIDQQRSGLTYEMGGLLEAMYFQFAQAITKGWRYRECPVCRKSFELAKGKNRANRQTCSITCRTYLYRNRMIKARELHAHGKTPEEIAKELDTSVKVVKNWIAKEQGP